MIINRIGFDYKLRELSHIVERTPQVNWEIVGRPADRQKSFRVVVTEKDNEIFDSFEVVSSKQYYVVPTPLPVDSELELCLTVISESGEIAVRKSIFSCAGELDADWICAADDIPNRPVIFTKGFKAKQDVESAYLYISGIGAHSVVINGYRLTADFDPAVSDYSKTCYYNVYPISHVIKYKSNKITVTVGDMWRRISSGFVDKNLGGRKIKFDGVPVLKAQIRIYYQDGSTEFISTDKSWKYFYGKEIYANLFNGWRYDGTAEPTKPKASKIYKGKLGVMKYQTLQGICPVEKDHRQDIIYPVAVFESGNDIVYDFGQNIAGNIVMNFVNGLEKGDKVSMLFGEMLNEDGSVYTAPLREAQCRDEYIASGESLVQIEPRFTYHGFRYVAVSMSDGIKQRGAAENIIIAACPYANPLDKFGTFQSGNALIDRIHQNVLMTERSNMMSLLTDCPQRDERMGWMNDATVRFEETPYNYDIGQMFPKIVRDILDAQSPDGAITCTAPFVFGCRPADPVCSSFLIAAYEAYMHTGNVEVIKDGFDGFCGWENYLLSRSDDYIVNYSYYGDWAAPAYACVTEEFACSAVTPGILMSTGYSYLNCKLIAEFAEVLGYKEKAEMYKNTAKNIADSFNKKWVNAETGEIECKSMGAYAFALWLGILPEEIREKAAYHMRCDLVNRNYQFTTGNLTSRYLLDMLAEYGYIDDAYKLLTKTDYPSFGFEINHGATTVWERWELKRNPDMNSHSHPMYGAADYFLHAYLAGVKVTKPGFERVCIKPYIPKDLYYCLDTIPTTLGNISVKWTVQYGKRILYLNIPFGMTADVDFCGIKKTVEHGTHIISADE